MPIIIFESSTSMSKREVEKTLKSSLMQMNWNPLHIFAAFHGIHEPFFGVVSNSSFRIMRVVRGRDSFNPMLYGRFWSSKQGTRVKVIITYHPITWFFMMAWTIFIGTIILQTFAGNDNSMIIRGFLILIIPWTIGISLFYGNATKSKMLLQQCLHLVNAENIDMNKER